MMTAIVDHEANDFALELLMPSDWLLRDAKGLDLADDAGVLKLARKYRVPVSTLAYRIGQLRAEQATPTGTSGAPTSD